MFTVIIPTRNRAEMVAELVEYLQVQLGWECPIILIDQSDDEGAALGLALQKARSQNVVHRPQRERGTSAARNEGARLARSSWLIFLDDDVRPVTHYLSDLAAFIQENPWVDAVQGAVEYDWEQYSEDRQKWESNRRRLQGGRSVGPKDGALGWFLRTPKAKYPCMVIGLGSGNLAISREAFFNAGGFDEQCDGLGEDIELGLRFWWYGYRVSLCPDAVAFHLRAKFGGTRPIRSRWETLFAPEPPPSQIYFLMKWFPGTPVRAEIARRAVKWMMRPWTVPIKVIRLTRSIREAQKRLRQGPRCLGEPICRSLAVTSAEFKQKVGAR